MSREDPIKKKATNKAWYERNKIEVIQKQKEKYNPEVQRAQNLKRLYDMSIGQYEELLASQGGGCAICEELPSGKRRYLCVDHDHVTGKVRGLLCHSCNRGLGLLGDSVELLEKATEYLGTDYGSTI